MAAAFAGAGAGGAGGNGNEGGDIMGAISSWIMETPPVTRYWTMATLATSVLVHGKVVSPFQLFYSVRAVWVKRQYWRLLTTFCYFGPFNLDLVFHVYFQQRYVRHLEDMSSAARFAYLLLFASACCVLVAPLLSIAFLSQPLSSTIVYIWSRKNPDTLLNFLGFFIFKAPYLPYVMMGLHVVMHGSVPWDEIIGAVIGHVWYFFNDVYPELYGNRRPLDPPEWWERIFDRRRPQPAAVADGDGGRDRAD